MKIVPINALIAPLLSKPLIFLKITWASTRRTVYSNATNVQQVLNTKRIWTATWGCTPSRSDLSDAVCARMRSHPGLPWPSICSCTRPYDRLNAKCVRLALRNRLQWCAIWRYTQKIANFTDVTFVRRNSWIYNRWNLTINGFIWSIIRTSAVGVTKNLAMQRLCEGTVDKFTIWWRRRKMTNALLLMSHSSWAWMWMWTLKLNRNFERRKISILFYGKYSLVIISVAGVFH